MLMLCIAFIAVALNTANLPVAILLGLAVLMIADMIEAIETKGRS